MSNFICTPSLTVTFMAKKPSLKVLEKDPYKDASHFSLQFTKRRLCIDDV